MSLLNWFFALAAAGLWGGAMVWYTYGDIKAAWRNYRLRWTTNK